MRIGIDIDDTTFLTVKSMLKYADLYQEELSGRPLNRDSFGMITNGYYLNGLYGWDNDTKFEFFDKYYKNVLEECTMLDGANNIINKLKEEGNSIHFITARLMNIEGCNTEGITKNSLKKFNIKYDTLDLHVRDKYSFMKDNNIDILIDDSYETCKKLNDNGIKAILVTTKMNENIDAGSIPRVNNWNEIYDLIKNI